MQKSSLQAGMLVLFLVVISGMLPGTAAGAGFGSYSSVLHRVDGFRVYSTTLGGLGVRSVVRQRDAKILVGGDFSISRGGTTWNALARLNADGTLDTSFSSPAGGPLLPGPVAGIALTPDPTDPAQERIYLAGQFGVARLSGRDGSLDPGFDRVPTQDYQLEALATAPGGSGLLVAGTRPQIVGGITVQQPVLAQLSETGALAWSSSLATVHTILIQGDQILAGGAALERFSLDGTLKETIAIPPPLGEIRALALQADGKMLVAADSSGPPSEACLARLNPDGTLDSSFKQLVSGQALALALQPDGRILAGGDLTVAGQQRYLVRLNLDGAPDGTPDWQLDGPVAAVAVQPDGNLLAAGLFATAKGKPRLGLARFYPTGTLDDDKPYLGLWQENPYTHALGHGYLISASVRPGGDLTLSGGFTHLKSDPAGPYLQRRFLARFSDDWSLLNDFDPVTPFDIPPYSQLPLPDRSMLIGGDFFTPLAAILKFDGTGAWNPLPAPNPTTNFNANLHAIPSYPGSLASGVQNLSLLEDGTFYLGGSLLDTPDPYRYLARFLADGRRDDSFLPDPLVDAPVFAALPMPDGTLIAGSGGRVLRLGADGALLRDMTPPQVGCYFISINALVLDAQNRLLVGGTCSNADNSIYRAKVVRLKNHPGAGDDGDLDPSYSMEGESYVFYEGYLRGLQLQADGGLVVYGAFDFLTDSSGATHEISYAARLTPDGLWDPGFDLSYIVSAAASVNILVSATQQPDGKIIWAGDFTEMAGVATEGVARFSNNIPAWQDLSVEQSADGSRQTVRWLRRGGLPELHRVWFEYSPDAFAASPSWIHLGGARRTAAGDGWELDVKQHPPAALPQGLPQLANGYLRARGYLPPQRSNSLIESLALFCLGPASGQKRDQTITWQLAPKTYGDGDFRSPVTVIRDGVEVTGLPLDFLSDNRVAGIDASGLIHLTGAGTGTLTVIQPGDANFNEARLEVTLNVAKSDQQLSGTLPDKVYVDPDFYPVVTLTRNGVAEPGVPLVYLSDLQVASVAADGLIRVTAAGSGVITITQAGDANYNPARLEVTLKVAKAAQQISCALSGRTYGDPDFTLRPAVWRGGVLQGPLDLTFASDQRVASIDALGVVHLTAAGSGSLTVLQPGDANYQEARVELTLMVAKAPQQLSFELAAHGYGDADFTLRPVLARGGAVQGPQPYVFSSDLKVATIDATGLIHLTAAGSGSISVRQPGDANYLEAVLTRELVVAPKTVTVRADDQTRAYRTANPPLTVRYNGFVNGETPLSAGLTGSPVLATDAVLDSPVGSYPITVVVDKPQQALSAPNYRFVAVNGSLNVVKSCQEIVFPEPGEHTFGEPSFLIQVSACSGLAIVLRADDPAQQVVRLNGREVTITGTGSVVLTASQSGTGDLEGAPEVSRTLTVHPSGQSISFQPLPGVLQGQEPLDLSPAGQPYAWASSGLPVSYRSSDPAVAEIRGTLVHPRGAGTAVITAEQQGNPNFLPALPVSQSLVVAADTVPPVLLLSALSTGAHTSNPVLNLAGNASDSTGISSITVNGRELSEPGAPFSVALPLKPGLNQVEVVARDGAGNRSTRLIQVSFDAAAPEVVLESPSDNSVTDLSLVQVTGRVSAGSTLTVQLNGGTPETLPVSQERFFWSCRLTPGLNTIEVRAQLGGRVAQLKRSVFWAADQPALGVTEPVQDLRTEQGEYLVQGTAGAGVGTVLLEVAGRSYRPVPAAGRFQQLVTLGGPGSYPVRVLASDESGASSQVLRNIVRVGTIYGDLDGDGCVDLMDAMAALRIALGLQQPDVWALAHADLAPLAGGVPQPDGRIDAGDVLVLLRKIVGLVDF
jgi:uncharacterized delta-60 repeat protein